LHERRARRLRRRRGRSAGRVRHGRPQLIQRADGGHRQHRGGSRLPAPRHRLSAHEPRARPHASVRYGHRCRGDGRSGPRARTRSLRIARVHASPECEVLEAARSVARFAGDVLVNQKSTSTLAHIRVHWRAITKRSHFWRQLPPVGALSLHGKEGVDGSSPSEGSAKPRKSRLFRSSAIARFPVCDG